MDQTQARAVVATGLTSTEAAELRVALDEAHATIAALTAENERLARCNAELAEVGHGLAHDIKNPLQAMFGFAELLAEGDGGELNPLGRQCVDAIRRAGRRLVSLVDDTLRAAESGASATVPFQRLQA